MNRAQRRALGKQQGRPAFRNDVIVSYLHPADGVAAPFCRSLAMLIAWDSREGGGRIAGQLPLESGANIVTARNMVARQFLELPNVEWLWIVDSDMEFAPDTLAKLLDAADAKERPIVGGLCFARIRSEAQQIVPTVYQANAAGELVRWHGYPEDQLFQVGGTGAACLLIHRSVLETMRDSTVSPELAQATGVPEGTLRFPPPWPWFAETITERDWGRTMSEDLTFCLRAQACGFPIFVDSRVKIGHQKPLVIDESVYRSNLPAAEPPAPTYVVIPVKGKQSLTLDILKQLDKQGGYEHIFVYDNAAGTDDRLGPVVVGSVTGCASEADPPPDVRSIEDAVANVTVIPAAGLNIHQMWNLGIKEALNRDARCNIAILNNDLELGENFLAEMAKGLRAHPSIAAVCGNYDNREFAELVQPVRGICAGRYDGTGGFAGFAFMIRSELVEALGGQVFDEQFEWYYGDNDLCIQLEALGATYGIARDAHVVHVDGGSRTMNGEDGIPTPDILEKIMRDRERFEKKYGVTV